MLKEKLKKLYSAFKKSIERFPVTTILVFIFTIINAICIDTEITNYFDLENINLFLVLFGCGTYLVESALKEDRKKVLGCIVSAVIAMVLTGAINLNIKDEAFSDIILRITTCYGIVTVIFSIFVHYKLSGITFEEYIKNVAVNIFKTSIIYVLISIGALIVSTTFVFLILDDGAYDLVSRIEILILGLYYVPKILYAFSDMSKGEDKFAKIVFRYALDILVILAFATIYIYIIKIIVTWNIPTNQIFRIIAALFVVGAPIWTVVNGYKEKDILGKINGILPILFIPFILLQVYTIGVRIFANGLTPARYVCVALILFEVIYIVMYIKNREKIGYILPVLGVFVVVAGVVPYVNMFKLSEISQYQILKMYTKNADLTDIEKAKIKGAYYYIKKLDNGEELIDKILTQSDINTITNFSSYPVSTDREDEEYDSIYLNNEKDNDSINIEGYKTMQSLMISCSMLDVENDSGKSLKEVEVSQGKFVDMTQVVTYFIENSDVVSQDFGKYDEYIVDDNTKLIFRDINIGYYKNSNKIRYCYITGYILQK